MRVPLYVAGLAAFAAWNLGRGDLRAATSVLVLAGLLAATLGVAARRRARRRSWAHDPVMVTIPLVVSDPDDWWDD